MSQFSDKNGKKNNPGNSQQLYQQAVRDISGKAQESLQKLDSLSQRRRDLEEQIRSTARARHEERSALYEQRMRTAAEEGADGEDEKLKIAGHGSLTAYQAKAYLKSHKQRKLVSESFLHRCWRYRKAVKELKEDFRQNPLLTDEKRRAAKEAAFRDCFDIYCSAGEEMAECCWDFLCLLASDSWEVLLFLVDMLITAAYYLRAAVSWIWDLIYDIRFWFESNKRMVFQIFAGGVTVASLLAVFISSVVAYEYSYYGRTLGIAKSKADVYRTIAVLGDKLSEATGANISLDVERDIEFTRVIGFKQDVDSTDDILNNLTYMRDIQVRAYAVEVGGENAVILESEDAAWKLLDRVKAKATPPAEGVEYTDIHFNENVTVSEVGVLLGDLWNEADAFRFLTTGSVKSTETPEPVLNVSSTATYTYFEDINYGTRYIENSSMYADETELVSAGVYGKQKIVATVNTTNGVEDSREIVSSVKISNPVDEVMYLGTKPLPAREGTGTFAYPMTTYTITSRFGMRWGRMHQGVDFAAPTGTKIYASDGGVVTFSGWKDGYGYVIMIDHGSLYSTVYAHCSKLLVETGEQVYQGQNIGLCGSTGNSTGPHCHFEVRYKGEAQNPLDYL